MMGGMTCIGPIFGLAARENDPGGVGAPLCGFIEGEACPLRLYEEYEEGLGLVLADGTMLMLLRLVGIPGKGGGVGPCE
jgi:hypothetical protein